MENRLKILILIKPFGVLYPKHKHKFDMISAIEDFADVYYWHDDGNIQEILLSIPFKPDFILHYDVAWRYRYAPKIVGFEKVDIPKGCYVIDIHYNSKKRYKYFKKNKFDLIFS